MRAASNPSNGSPDLMLMHNTRIFYFERDPIQQEKQIKCVPLDQAADEMTNNINGIYLHILSVQCAIYTMQISIFANDIISIFYNYFSSQKRQLK